MDERLAVIMLVCFIAGTFFGFVLATLATSRNATIPELFRLIRRGR